MSKMYDHQNPNGTLPNEVIQQILTKLPSKTVCRFKIVSKTWLSIICNPHFISSYLTLSSPSWVVFDRVNTESSESIQFNIVENPKITTFSLNPHVFVDEPVIDVNRIKFPDIIASYSHGLLLLSLQIKRDPHKEHAKIPNSFSWRSVSSVLIVVSPVTCEWVPLPRPSVGMINKRYSLGFVACVDLCGVLEKFVVVEYQPIIGSERAYLLCFSSETGKWVEKGANYMLGMHFWRGDGVFEFRGRLNWIDLSCGIITLDDDPFRFFEEEEKAVCRFIPLPRECIKSFKTPGLEDQRCIWGVEGYVQYMEVFKEGDSVVKLWRLNDYESCDVEWSLIYNVARRDVERMPKTYFIHPFEADTAFFRTEDHVFSYDFRSQKVEICGGYNGHEDVMLVVLPSWPTLLPLRLHADCAKGKGNDYFKDQNYIEAIKCYSRSIALSPNALAYANRAMAYLKLSRFCEAEADCSEALNLNSKNVKAYGRRAIARKELGNLEGSMEDVEFALKLEPNSIEMKELLEEIKSSLEKVTSMMDYDQGGAARDLHVDDDKQCTG